MKLGDRVTILPSQDLILLRLRTLAGLTAKVVEINGTFDHIHGCWVELPREFLGEKEWYIPYNSLGV